MTNEKIKVIVFDLEEVVIDTWHKLPDIFPELKSFSKEFLTENLYGGSDQREFFVSKITEAEFWKRKIELLKLNRNEKELERTVRQLFVELPGMRYLVQELKKRYKVALLTNFPKEWFDFVKEKFDFGELFDASFVSGYTGVRKPIEQAYTEVLQHFKIKPDECLFIDDKPRNIEGAQKIGVNTILFQSARQLKNELKNWISVNFRLATNVFRAYDIRGVIDVDLTKELVEKIGRAFGFYLKAKDVAIGRDLRSSGENLKNALISGLTSIGCNVTDVGIVPTPVLYFTVASKRLDGGAIITASHLPSEWNGIKLCRKNAAAFTREAGIEEIKKISISDGYGISNVSGEIKHETIIEEYVNSLVKKFSLGKRLKIVVDIGNGTCGEVAKKIFSNFDLDTKFLFFEPDESFPNHVPNPLYENSLAQLQENVVAEGADLGIAFDADGDRIGFVDNKGRIVRSDVISLIFINKIMLQHPGSKILLDVRCSRAVQEYTKQLGGTPMLVPVGHSYIKEAMFKEDAPLACEFSGHYFFRENFRYDDAFFAAMKMIETLSHSNEKFSSLVDSLPKNYNTPEFKPYFPDEKKFGFIEELRKKLQLRNIQIIDVDGIRAEFEYGWFLIRASNTEPAIVIRAEAKTPEKLEEIKNFVEKLLNEKGVSIL